MVDHHLAALDRLNQRVVEVPRDARAPAPIDPATDTRSEVEVPTGEVTYGLLQEKRT
jgi:hypothetical protein